MVAGIVAIGLRTATESPTLDVRLAGTGIGHPFAPRCPVSRRLARGWPVGPPAASGAPWPPLTADHLTAPFCACR
jgi:hypothetical protein